MVEDPKPKLRLAKRRYTSTAPLVGPGEKATGVKVESLSPVQSTGLPSCAINVGGPVVYDGKGWELMKIYARNVVLSLLTLGIYQFYAQIHLRRYHSLHTQVAGGRFFFHATGGRKFRAFVIALLFLSTCLVGGWVVINYLIDQQIKGNEVLAKFRIFVLFFGFSFLLWMLTPVIRVGRRRFLLAYTSWRNVRFQFKGSIGKLYLIYILDGILIVLTLGIYYPWHQVRVHGFLTRNAYLGNTAFGYRGMGGELFKIEFMGWIFNYLTLGIYGPWLWAKRKRYHINNTQFQGKFLQCNLSGEDAIRGIGLGSLIVICTLGLGFPWAVCRWKRILFESIKLSPSIELGRIQGEATENSGIAEALGDAGDFLEQLGEVFG